METAITVAQLRKSYKDNAVLKGVDFSVERGKIFALLGSNGAGKTTTINILTTLIPADSGSAVIHGFDIAKRPDKVRSSISLTGQFAAVDDILTGRENLHLIAELRHVSNAAQITTELLQKFGLTEAADRRALTYSGGMRRRLDIAMSLIGNPPIIFLDEPTTGLDPQARNDMWRTIKKLADNGTTIFLTTQYLEEADVLADTIALLHKGTIVASGTARELKRLVPSGLVEMTFNDKQQLQAAVNTLKRRYVTEHNENLTLTVVVGEGTKQLAELFIALRDAHIEPIDFSQKVPTLDDVFFKLIGEKKEDK